MKKNLSDFTKSAIQIALEAGNLLKDGFYSSYKISHKEGVQNLVTEFDLKSEDLIISSLQHLFPSSSFLSEEMGEIQNDSDKKWIIDPLDGTVNFAHRIPLFCVNIAFEQEGIISSAVTFNPMTQELFYAEKNKGAYLNDSRIFVSKTIDLPSAFLSTGFPYNLKDDPDICIRRLSNLLQIGLPIRRLGSAALDLAYVAAGTFDGYWETNLKPWDCAAGLLFIQEAGGTITDFKNIPFQLMAQNDLVCSNRLIHEPLLKMLNSHLKT